MPEKYTKSVFVFMTAFLWAGISVADTYKWLDPEGNVVYSQTMPSGGQAVETLKKVEPLEPEPPDEETLLVEELERQIAEREARIKKNCDVARYNKAVLQTPANVVVPDEEGNDILLTPSQKESQLAEAKGQIDIYCG